MKKKDIIYQNMLTLVTTIIKCQEGGYNALRKTIVSHCLNLCQNNVFKMEQID